MYDFLFERDYESWFCNLARQNGNSVASTRPLYDFILGLHTGESIASATPSLGWPSKRELGQRLLVKLASDILAASKQDPTSDFTKARDSLGASLELDGYKFKDSQLVESETGVLDVEEVADSLTRLYGELNLANSEIALNHLKLSEEHYLAKRWGDCISNSRNFLEGVLQEIAANHSLKFRHMALATDKFGRAAEVRNYLEAEGLIEPKEKQTISAIYGLLSNTGSHPYMAESEQARLLRQLALVLSEFVMLRYQSNLAGK